MAIRHEVENLIRRGNIFYWRARIPTSFARCQPGSRLSLSLHCSDHKKAKMIGRKLNVRLAELKMNSKESMSTKDQLQKLFEHERDAMLEHLEDVAMIARRYGRPADIEELELDLENGWTYRLLAMFGIGHRLTLEDTCSGRAYLLAKGVPVSHIPAIKSNYREEFDLASSPGFQDGIRTLMQQFGIEAHPLNQEKAMKAYFGGRADALFDVEDRHPLADRNLSELTGGSRPDHPPPMLPTTIEQDVSASRPSHDIIAPSASQVPLDEAAEIRVLDLRPATPPIATDIGKALPPAPVVSISDFEPECDRLTTNMADWESGTASDAKALVRLLKGILEEYGVEHSGQITQYHLGQLRQHFNAIPKK